MDSEQPVCPACGQPVETVVRRHKTLGAWVPVWTHGPCRNRECEKCPDHETEAGAAPPGSGRTVAPEPVSARRNTGGEAPTAR
ncbi:MULTISPECIES: hypothetical protein [unclassified Streptomyces]|uniref:hypothetical protein n=1 Tax=unclassified Streptomyces TaxID=2593676 RepID=UPI000A1D7262|nr:hypothetical protein [Streptomyces sp. 13-12-16]OSP43856.1 hypothetical protein B7767_08015 [Streptomyces sp. 13-12-16]